MPTPTESAPVPLSPPITKYVVQEMARKIDLHVPAKYEADFTEMLISAREVMDEVAGMDGRFITEALRIAR